MHYRNFIGINLSIVSDYFIYSGEEDSLQPKEFKNPDTLANFLKLI
jgi:hypothetical protein